MNDRLQKKLFSKYPKLFRQKDLSIKESCMPWGIDCGDGWYSLLDCLCQAIQEHCVTKGFQVEFSQVKEKFGTARVYTNGSDDVVDSLIGFASLMSSRTCEYCGDTATARTRGHAWLSTLCDACDEKEKKGRKKWKRT